MSAYTLKVRRFQPEAEEDDKRGFAPDVQSAAADLLPATSHPGPH